MKLSSCLISQFDRLSRKKKCVLRLYMQNQSAQSAHDSMKISAHWEILGVFVDSLRQHYASLRFQIHVRRKMTFQSKLWSSFFATFALISLSSK